MKKQWQLQLCGDNIMEKKTLVKIRLKQDGTWEHVYQDGSVDQEFYELSIVELAKMQREKYLNQSQDYLEQAVQISGYKDAIEVIDYIRKLK
jgi:protein-arginine kinase activator protein McsA